MSRTFKCVKFAAATAVALFLLLFSFTVMLSSELGGVEQGVNTLVSWVTP